MNLLTPIKKFVKMDRENKALRLVCIGFLGILTALILDLCKVLPETETTAAELILGVFIVSFGVGSLMMVSVLLKHDEKVARFMGGGAFALVGLMCCECVVDYLVEHLTPVTLPQITAWYAFPCLAVFFIGLLMLVGQSIAEAWKNA